MAVLAAVCGVMIVVFGVITTRHSPTDAQFGVEVTCLVGGLVLIFLGVLLGRLGQLAGRIDAAAPERGGGRASTDVEEG